MKLAPAHPARRRAPSGAPGDGKTILQRGPRTGGAGTLFNLPPSQAAAHLSPVTPDPAVTSSVSLQLWLCQYGSHREGDKRTQRAGENISKDQKKSSSSEMKLWETDVILCACVYPNPPMDVAWEEWICPTGVTEATPHHFWVSHDVSGQRDQLGTLRLTCLTSREAQTPGHLASY